MTKSRTYDHAKILGMYRQGFIKSEIAKKFGCNIATVSYVINEDRAKQMKAMRPAEAQQPNPQLDRQHIRSPVDTKLGPTCNQLYLIIPSKFYEKKGNR